MKAVRYFALRVLIVSTTVLLGAVSVGYGRVIYVDDDANGLKDGSSWINAYKFLQDALADANSGEKPVELRVAKGIYKPDRSSTNPSGTGDREATFLLLNDVTLKGSYAGVGEADPNTRDITKYETILSGDLAGDDLEVNNPADLLTEPSRAENSYHVLTSSDTNETAVLDGFTVTGGNAYESSPLLLPQDFGGGMYNKSGSPIVIDCTFRGNSAVCGGAIWCEMSSSQIVDCNISGNMADQNGGGIDAWGGCPVISRCLLTENTSGITGGSIRYGGNQDPIISYCTISRNSSAMGGGIFLSCGSTTTRAKIENCIITGNHAQSNYHGGGIQLMGAGLTLENTTHNGNITNCVISGNSYGIDIQGGGWTIKNCTISKNKLIGIQYDCSNNSLLFNTILWDNGLQLSITCTFIGGPVSTYVIVSHSNVKGGLEEVDVWLPRWIDWKNSNINVDPCFANPGYWEPNGTPDNTDDDFWVDGDFHLKSQAGRWDPVSQTWVKDDVTSTCIDAGDPMSPIGFEQFPNGGRINMGAYGGTTEASKSYFGEPLCEIIIAGDINGDCKVDFLDLAILASHWMEDNSPRGAVTTTYDFLADKSTIIAYCGRGGIRTYSIQGTFRLIIDFDAYKARFEKADATLSDEIRFVDDYPPAKEISTESLDVLFHMTELISTDVNDTSLSFVFYKNIPTFPGADVHLRVVLQNNSAYLTGTFSDAVYDGCWYDLNAVAVVISEDP